MRDFTKQELIKYIQQYKSGELTNKDLIKMQKTEEFYITAFMKILNHVNLTKDKSMTHQEALNLSHRFELMLINKLDKEYKGDAFQKDNIRKISDMTMTKWEDLNNSKYVSPNEVDFLKSLPELTNVWDEEIEYNIDEVKKIYSKRVYDNDCPYKFIKVESNKDILVFET